MAFLLHPVPRRIRHLELLCWLTVLGCALYSGFAWQQAHAARRLSALPAGDIYDDAGYIASGTVIGQMNIPSLGLSVPVLEDDQTGSLQQGVGHIRGTALPGGLGTVGLAGHRDTFLRPLQKIAPAMEVDLSRGPALYRYVVDRTEIVRPEAVGVLAWQNTPELVLVTCYPFHYIGAAPMRFIVYAHLLSLAPDQVKR